MYRLAENSLRETSQVRPNSTLFNALATLHLLLVTFISDYNPCASKQCRDSAAGPESVVGSLQIRISGWRHGELSETPVPSRIDIGRPTGVFQLLCTDTIYGHV